MLASHIKDLRKEAGLSQERLAEQLGVSRQAVTRWETGLGTPDLDNLVALADLFGVSVDSLLRDGEPEPAEQDDEAGFSSVTQCDVFSPHDFDIHYGNVHSVTLMGTQSSKVRVVLTSDTIANVEEGYKVRLDPDGKNFDIDVVPMESATAAEARAALDVCIQVPASWENEIELAGSADIVSLERLAATEIEVGTKFDQLKIRDVIGHVEVDTNQDLLIECATMPARLDVNQVSATSKLCIPKDAQLSLRKRGFGNHFVLTDVSETEGAPCMVELNGMKSELTICAQEG